MGDREKEIGDKDKRGTENNVRDQIRGTLKRGINEKEFYTLLMKEDRVNS